MKIVQRRHIPPTRRPTPLPCHSATGAVPVRRAGKARPRPHTVAGEISGSAAVLSGTLMTDSDEEPQMMRCELTLAHPIARLTASSELMISGGVLTVSEGGVNHQVWILGGELSGSSADTAPAPSTLSTSARVCGGLLMLSEGAVRTEQALEICGGTASIAAAPVMMLG